MDKNQDMTAREPKDPVVCQKSPDPTDPAKAEPAYYRRCLT